MMKCQGNHGNLERAIRDRKIGRVHFHPGRCSPRTFVNRPPEHATRDISANDLRTSGSKHQRHFTGPGTEIEDFLAAAPSAQTHGFTTSPSANEFHHVIKVRMAVVMME